MSDFQCIYDVKCHPDSQSFVRDLFILSKSCLGHFWCSQLHHSGPWWKSVSFHCDGLLMGPFNVYIYLPDFGGIHYVSILVRSSPLFPCSLSRTIIQMFDSRHWSSNFIICLIIFLCYFFSLFLVFLGLFTLWKFLYIESCPYFIRGINTYLDMNYSVFFLLFLVIFLIFLQVSFFLSLSLFPFFLLSFLFVCIGH